MAIASFGGSKLRPTIVASALSIFDGDRYVLDSFVVMPNHVHALLVQPLNGHSLSEILHSWKSFSGKRDQPDAENGGAIWQDENYDRIVRDSRSCNDFETTSKQSEKAG